MFVFARFVQLNILQNDVVVPPEYLKTARTAAGLGDGEGTSARVRALAEIQHFNFRRGRSVSLL